MPVSVRMFKLGLEGRKKSLSGVFLLPALVVLLGSLPISAQTLQESSPMTVPAQEAHTSPSATGNRVPPASSITDLHSSASGEAGPSTPVTDATPAAAPAQMPAAKADRAVHDLTPMGMFLNADPVVQAVMVMLAAASVVTWTILLVKVLTLGFAKRRMRGTLTDIREAVTLADASQRVRRGVGALLLVEAEEELGLSRGLQSEGIKERAAIALQRIEAMVGKRMASGTGILATIGSIGPFVGLFGTVWGIMGSFVAIANSNTTNLAVVAPGIAEALLATGIGLVAAIPAVVIYNALIRSITSYRAMVADATVLIMRHLSRDLDRRAFESRGPEATIRAAAE